MRNHDERNDCLSKNIYIEEKHYRLKVVLEEIKYDTIFNH